MDYVTLDENGFATADGFIKYYGTNEDGEYNGAHEEFISYSTGLPAGGYIDEPPAAVEGMAIVRRQSGWEFVEDHRGQIVYIIATGQEVVVKNLGPLPDTVTPEKPQKSKSELYSIELAELGAALSYDVQSLSVLFAKAALVDGVNEQTKKLAIYNEYQQRKAKNVADVAALKLKYGV